MDIPGQGRVRRGSSDELDQLARIWYDGWQDAHAGIVPRELAKYRTFESFRQRLADSLPELRTVGAPGRPLGFSVLKADELYQLYVAADARGSGVAAALIADAERRLGARGFDTAWLTCAIGNHRAARFYEKQGWRRIGNVMSQLPTADGNFPLEVWRYEKSLQPVTIEIVTSTSAGLLDDVDEDVFDEAIRPGELQAFLENPANLLLVARAGETVIGMASAIAYVHPDKPLQLFINEVGVAESFQRCGIGRRLMSAMLQQGRERGCREAWVATEVGNRAARALYRAVGGEEDAEPAIVYQYRL